MKASIIQLSVKARKLGIDVDAIIEEHYQLLFRKLEDAICAFPLPPHRPASDCKLEKNQALE